LFVHFCEYYNFFYCIGVLDVGCCVAHGGLSY
jgi:hypothetical protein